MGRKNSVNGGLGCGYAEGQALVSPSEEALRYYSRPLRRQSLRDCVLVRNSSRALPIISRRFSEP